jgi:hypothetical protein
VVLHRRIPDPHARRVGLLLGGAFGQGLLAAAVRGLGELALLRGRVGLLGVALGVFW